MTTDELVESMFLCFRRTEGLTLFVLGEEEYQQLLFAHAGMTYEQMRNNSIYVDYRRSEFCGIPVIPSRLHKGINIFKDAVTR